MADYAAVHHGMHRIVTLIANALLVVLCIASASVHAQELVPVPTMQGHPPLFIYRDSVQREGATVFVTYLLETPTGSNSIDATIDCAARTYVTRGVRVHPETIPAGAERRIPPEPPRSIGAKSTWDFLAQAVCK